MDFSLRADASIVGNFRPETRPPRGKWADTWGPAPPIACIASLYLGGFRIDDLQRVFHISQKTIERALASTGTPRRPRFKLTPEICRKGGLARRGKKNRYVKRSVPRTKESHP